MVSEGRDAKEIMKHARAAKTIRQGVYILWVANPILKAWKICEILHLAYHRSGAYVNKLLSEFRSYHVLGSPQKALKRLPHRRVFVWECVPRKWLDGWLLERGIPKDDWLGVLGWRRVVNRNGMLVYRDHKERGTVHWYKGGLVRLYLKGPVVLARAKELFCEAFKFIPKEQLFKFVDAPLREESRHWVFDVGSPLPRFDIRQFERSHGIRIFVDGSHPTAVEVIESSPFWLTRLETAVENFGIYMKDHLGLVREIRDGRAAEVEVLKKFTELLELLRRSSSKEDGRR